MDSVEPAPRREDEPRRVSARRTGQALRQVALFSGAGFTMAASVVIGAWAGHWADQRWGTEPWLLVFGFLLGALAGFVQLIRLVTIASR